MPALSAQERFANSVVNARGDCASLVVAMIDDRIAIVSALLGDHGRTPREINVWVDLYDFTEAQAKSLLRREGFSEATFVAPPELVVELASGRGHDISPALIAIYGTGDRSVIDGLCLNISAGEIDGAAVAVKAMELGFGGREGDGEATLSVDALVEWAAAMATSDNRLLSEMGNYVAENLDAKRDIGSLRIGYLSAPM